MSDYQLFQGSVNISITSKSEFCFPPEACINMPNKQATHASLMGQREVPPPRDCQAAWHLGVGHICPTLQPEQGQTASAGGVNEWMQIPSGWTVGHLQPLWLCSINNCTENSRCCYPLWCLCQAGWQHKRYQLLYPASIVQKSGLCLFQENSVLWHKVLIWHRNSPWCREEGKEIHTRKKIVFWYVEVTSLEPPSFSSGGPDPMLSQSWRFYCPSLCPEELSHLDERTTLH